MEIAELVRLTLLDVGRDLDTGDGAYAKEIEDESIERLLRSGVQVDVRDWWTRQVKQQMRAQADRTNKYLRTLCSVGQTALDLDEDEFFDGLVVLGAGRRKRLRYMTELDWLDRRQVIDTNFKQQADAYHRDSRVLTTIQIRAHGFPTFAEAYAAQRWSDPSEWASHSVDFDEDDES